MMITHYFRIARQVRKKEFKRVLNGVIEGRRLRGWQKWGIASDYGRDMIAIASLIPAKFDQSSKSGI
jgi:hypothetical protein